LFFWLPGFLAPIERGACDGQGLTYNLSRKWVRWRRITIGYVETLPNVGIGSALALTSAFFLAGAILIMFFEDTSRTPLAESAQDRAGVVLFRFGCRLRLMHE
jgi:hypothetical protein